MSCGFPQFRSHILDYRHLSVLGWGAELRGASLIGSAENNPHEVAVYLCCWNNNNNNNNVSAYSIQRDLT